ncbi:MAG: glycosyl transferase, partial [Burkholderiales bacterium]
MIEKLSHDPRWDSEQILREEIFSVERLEEHARSLAASQPISTSPGSGRLLGARLRNNEKVLLSAYRSIAKAVDEGRSITPAAEWVLDNYHVVEEQIREIRDDLPPGYYRQLPKLAGGPLAGYPRVFGIAWAFVAHTDSRFDSEMLRRFVRAYQRVQPLTIGELWAVAITLRVALVENLRRAAMRIRVSRAAREEADTLADRLLGVNARSAEPVAVVLRGREQAPLDGAFAVQLVQRLRDQDPKVTPALVWLEERLAAQGASADEIVYDEHQRQGATNVTVRNIITSMRLISDVDWAQLVESVSLIDDLLRPVSAFAEMDFATRNLYRSAIEELARGSKLTELEIAHAALAAASGGENKDPGYHLIAAGRRAFEAKVGFRAPLRSWPSRFNAAIGLGGYIGAVGAVAAVVLALPIFLLNEQQINFVWLAVLAALGLTPSIDAAMALVNRAVTREVGATILPGLALRDGVPGELRTLVAVPILLSTREELEEQIERLEIHYLASPEGELHFALLSDWTDADAESIEGDEALLAAAAAGIARLNRRHGPAAGGERFLLLHRRRVWNEGQRRWIGWERKRGKLHELNRLLRGAVDTTFIKSVVPAGVRYVITLDADTRMPREAARRLIGKMAHPLNRPRLDGGTRRVVEGYGVLQPRVTPSLPVGREGSLFQRIFSSMNGIDPYAAAVSDVYQDLLGEGSYTGKGIYDVDAFEAALEGRVRENTLLSHDLFEGTFARAGLASDIEVVEEFPARYDVAAARQHRWTRGDWQLLPWILGGAGALPPLGRWKMVDNLRRSLSAPASLAALVAGWTLPLQAALVWTGFIVATIALATLLPVLAAIVPRRARITLPSHLRALVADVRLALFLTGLQVGFLAHQAWLMADAIGRTLYRLLVSRRHLLDWVTAGQAAISRRLDLPGFYWHMAGGPVFALVAIVIVWWKASDAWPVALPFVLAWIASPAIARWTSLSPLVAGRVPVSPTDARALRRVARRTWRFFETFVTATEHWLPPDNFQEDPKPVVARRTSPTNIGLYLLSAVTARDFGWAGATDTLERLEATLATMGKLARFRGHF